MGMVSVEEFRQYLEQLKKYSPQAVTVTGAPSGGTFKLGYENQQSADIAYNATASTVRTALAAVTGMPTDVEVTGPAGGPWEVVSKEFAGPLSMADNDLTGGTSPGVVFDLVTDQVAEEIIERATSMIEEILGFSFDGYAESTKTVQAYGGTILQLPPHEIGSVSTLTFLGDTFEITGWAETERGNLMTGVTYPYEAEWQCARYTVTANWGYGDPPEAIKEVCLELSVNIWRGRDRGMWTEVVGPESTGLRFTGGMTRQQGEIIKAVRSKYTRIGI